MARNSVTISGVGIGFPSRPIGRESKVFKSGDWDCIWVGIGSVVSIVVKKRYPNLLRWD
jgi:hypothetical protein